ncbi:MAG: sugar transferase [candidate division Zixibacteria bacterium]|nr:sugar transferase [candidate division Zixibacteria bacterium]
MRYQSPIVNPLSQYWEEELFIGGTSRYWKETLARFKYYSAEYLLANFILIYSILKRTLSLRPLVDTAVRFYRIYGFTWSTKRAIDIAGSAFGIVCAIPFFIIVPILIKLDSPGPIFFKQERIGKNRRRNNRRDVTVSGQVERRISDRRKTSGYGRPFMIAKFRTMRQDAEKHTGPVWATKRDPRITRLGAFLRATRIDEIPQLFNILKGDMSLVGPRPERAFFIDTLKETITDYEQRLLVRPGLTGLAQVEHKYDESEEDTVIKVDYDLTYINRLNILRDIKIMLKTIYVVLAAKGM